MLVTYYPICIDYKYYLFEKNIIVLVVIKYEYH